MHVLRLVLPLLLATALPIFPSRPADAATTANTRIKIATQYGDIVVQLEEKRAPKTVANFLHYVDTKFYDGGTFFRAIPAFVIQGGNQSKEKPTDTQIVLEPPKQTGIHNKDGVISMARTSEPNSATSEFFICDGDQPALDETSNSAGYAAFGHVLSGMGIVRKIARLPAESEHLLKPVEIQSITRVR